MRSTPSEVSLRVCERRGLAPRLKYRAKAVGRTSSARRAMRVGAGCATSATQSFAPGSARGAMQVPRATKWRSSAQGFAHHIGGGLGPHFSRGSLAPRRRWRFAARQARAHGARGSRDLNLVRPAVWLALL